MPTVVLLVLQSGYFVAGFETSTWSIERYVMYAVPLLIVLTVVALDQRRLAVRELAIAGAVVVLPLLATPEIRLALEERAQFGTVEAPRRRCSGSATGPRSRSSRRS